MRVRIGAILRVRVRNSQIFVISAAGIAIVNSVNPFGRFTVTFKVFMPNRIKTKGYRVNFDELLALICLHLPLMLKHHEAINIGVWRHGLLVG